MCLSEHRSLVGTVHPAEKRWEKARSDRSGWRQFTFWSFHGSAARRQKTRAKHLNTSEWITYWVLAGQLHFHRSTEAAKKCILMHPSIGAKNDHHVNLCGWVRIWRSSRVWLKMQDVSFKKTNLQYWQFETTGSSSQDLSTSFSFSNDNRYSNTHNQASNPALGQIDSALAPVAVWLAKFMEQSCLTCRRKACHNCPCCLDMEDTGRLQLEPNRLEKSGCQSVCNLIIFIEVSV